MTVTKRPSLKPADFWKDVKVEAKRYVADSYAILVAPFHWSVADWERAAGAAVLIGGLMLEDKHLDHEFQKNRSTFTNRVSQATTGFGGGYGVNTGLAFLIVGYVFRSWDVRETGRETLEAGPILRHHRSAAHDRGRGDDQVVGSPRPSLRARTTIGKTRASRTIASTTSSTSTD